MTAAVSRLINPDFQPRTFLFRRHSVMPPPPIKSPPRTVISDSAIIPELPDASRLKLYSKALTAASGSPSASILAWNVGGNSQVTGEITTLTSAQGQQALATAKSACDASNTYYISLVRHQ